jgi:uncharacterized protein (DUF885 family)
MKTLRKIFIVFTAFISISMLITESSAQRSTASGTSQKLAVTAIADEYIREYTSTFPVEAALLGVPSTDAGKLSDRSATARLAWEARQDVWLRRLARIDQATLMGTPEWVIYGQLKEKLESDRLLRVCQRNLWNVNQMFGWQVNLPRIAGQQPLGSPAEQEQALSRWRAFPQFIDVEIANLREGIRKGYLAPKRIVQLVTEQLDQVLAVPVEESPFFPASARKGSPELRATWTTMVREKINPAIKRYRDYLATEYIRVARESLGVSANPNGRACYDASFRNLTTLNRSAKETSELGAQRVKRFDEEAKRIALERFHTGDLDAVEKQVKNDSARRFTSRDELLAFARDAVERGEKAAHQMFERFPRARVVVEPHPAYLERTASDQYFRAPTDGSRPAVYRINLYQPQEKLRADAETTAFHETFPGHHLQVGITNELPAGHPAARSLGNAAFSEGWARYAEGLAEELGLYSEDYARISRRRWPGRGMVVDPGIHVFGWTREQAVNYITASGRTKEDAEKLVDRIAVLPAQLTAYDTGGLEFEALRAHAQKTLGVRFDLRAFHDQVLGVGNVPFLMLRSVVDRWIVEQK